MITLEDFSRLDLRIGEVISVEPIPGASRLLKVQVDLGEEQRDLVAGLSEYYTAEELIGQKVVVVTNLKPASIRGVLSQGMMLGVGCSGGQDVALLTTNKDVPNGARVE